MISSLRHIILILAILLPFLFASDRKIVILDPETNAALLRYRYRIETSLTTGAMEAATQELYFTLGVKPDDNEDKQGKGDKKKQQKKRVARTAESESS